MCSSFEDHKLGRAASSVSEKESTRSATVFIGMSGGVDSSVSAVFLKEQGYKVVGVYMKNWSKDLPGMKCPWAEDLADAKRVAVKLDIDFEVWDFEKDYKKKVVDYMLEEFKLGRTPNPDIMCNQEIKFKLFYDVAREHGADFIATGHYAQVKDGKLLLAEDDNKDQTYFLYRISKDALTHTLFPIGHLKKTEVKKIAEEKGLSNAYKKESMGVCFVGDVGMKDFLREYIETKPGEIREIESNKVLGYHDGAIFYTLGQRHGLNVGGGLPYYVVKKDLEKNIVYVSKNLNEKNLWTKEMKLNNLLFREMPEGTDVEVRLRHRAPLIPAKLTFKNRINLDKNNETAEAVLTFEEEIKRPASGQSAVIYQKSICLGGGILV